MPLLAYWYNKGRNLGDSLNPWLLTQLSGSPVEWVDPAHCREPHYVCMGSVFHFVGSESIVWGTGIIAENRRPTVLPKKILAVRGPLTRKILVEMGTRCPAVFGDPALLLPHVYDPTVEKRFALGIVPHYVDKAHPWVSRLQHEDGAKIVDVESPDPLQPVRDILSCDAIVSSSLHGLIVADAYRVPNMWVDFNSPGFSGHRPTIIGGGFKFLDYFASVRRPAIGPRRIRRCTTVRALIRGVAKTYTPPEFDPTLLLHACEFHSFRDRAPRTTG
jgi:pyruvyltransferase